jgi:hypothetical protein
MQEAVAIINGSLHVWLEQRKPFRSWLHGALFHT